MPPSFNTNNQMTINQSTNDSIKLHVNSPHVTYTPTHITSNYVYRNTRVEQVNNQYQITPTETSYQFQTESSVPRTGVMMVGWGGM